MNFVFPTFLFALGLVAIPIIIHLFNFRRYKTVYFTNVKFLKEVKEETAVRSKVKHLLVLLSRILAIIFLVLAFAQPFIPISDAEVTKQGNRAISIYLDNSFSMNTESDEPLLNKAKRKAQEIVKAYSETDRFQLLTNEFDGRQQRFVSQEEFLSMLEEVKTTAKSRTLNQVHAQQKRIFGDENIKNKLTYWISDFQKNMVDFTSDTALSLFIIPLQPSKKDNIYIDSAWLEKPLVYLDEPNLLFVKIVNGGEHDIEESRLTLSINNQVKALADYSVIAGSYTIDTLNFSVRDVGWKELEVAINDYPITFDDKYYLTFRITDQVNVLAINDQTKSPYLQALYANAEKFVFQNQNVNRLDYSGLTNFSLIVLNDLIAIPSGLGFELKQYLQSGGVLLIFPNPKADIGSYNRFFSSVNASNIIGLDNTKMDVTFLNKEHELFTNVFEKIPDNISLPSTSLNYRFTKSVKSTEQILLGFRDGSSFVSRFDFALGKIYNCSSPLDVNYTDYPVHALFVPMLYRMALSGGSSRKSSYVLGSNEIIEIENKLSNNDMVYKVKGADIEFIPEQKAVGPKVLVNMGEQLHGDGIYNIYSADEKSGELVALNFNRIESVLEYYTTTELKDHFSESNIRVIDVMRGDITEFVKELDKGIILWKLCIIFALIFFAAEVLLLRFLPRKV